MNTLRVAIVGGCQVVGLKHWMQTKLAGAEVAAWHVSSSSDVAPERILPLLHGYDVIVTQIPPGHEGGLLDEDRLRARAGTVVFLPTVVFAGFHPDLVFIPYGCDGRYAIGPTGMLHSALVFAGFRLGIPAARVPDLFNTLVFQACGYLDAFADARAALLKNFAGHGYDLSSAFDDWFRHGAFMYTDNHPHIRVLGTLAQQVLVRAGLPATASDEPVADNLAASVNWPIHQPLARRLRINGSEVFLRPRHEVASEDERAITLADFVSQSYAAYASLAGSTFHPFNCTETTLHALRKLLA